MPAETSESNWTITGVSPATQKAARAAATREHVELGEWIERAVARSAEAQRADPAHQEHPDQSHGKHRNYRPDRRYF